MHTAKSHPSCHLPTTLGVLHMAAFNLFSAKPIFVLCIVPVQHLAFDLIELHEFYTGPPLRLARVTLGGTPSPSIEI